MVDQVDDQIPRNQFIASAGQTVFAYNFQIFSKADITVTTSLQGTLLVDIDYTLSGVGDISGGNVTLMTGATANEIITIFRSMPFDRVTDYQESGDFLAQTVDDDFNRLWLAGQQDRESISRSLQYQIDDIAGTSGLPVKADRSSKFLGFDSSGNPISVPGTTSPIVDVYLRRNTVADMISDTTLVIGDFVETAGYTTKGDGGDNRYEIAAASTGIDDGGSFIDLITHQAKSLFPLDLVNVVQFGAINDSVTDSLSNFQAAIDFQEKFGRNGGIVDVPKGGFALGGTLRIGGWVTLRGKGSFSSALQFLESFTSGNCIELGPDQSGTFVFSGSYTFGSRLEGLNINAKGVFRGFDAAVVYTVGAHQPSAIVQCDLTNVISIGIHHDVGLGGPANFTIESVDITGTATVPTSGQKIGIRSSAGGAALTCNRVNVQTDGTAPFDTGIEMIKDRLISTANHFEGCAIGILLNQNQTVRGDNVIISASTGPNVPVLIQRSSTANTGFVAINAINKSIVDTGLIVINDIRRVYSVVDRIVPFYNSDQRIQTVNGVALTITTGILTIAAPVVDGVHVVDTESAVSTDDVDTISPSAGIFDDGVRITFRPSSNIRTVVFKNGTGNIFTKTGADVTLNAREKTITFMFAEMINSFVEV